MSLSFLWTVVIPADLPCEHISRSINETAKKVLQKVFYYRVKVCFDIWTPGQTMSCKISAAKLYLKQQGKKPEWLTKAILYASHCCSSLKYFFFFFLQHIYFQQHTKIMTNLGESVVSHAVCLEHILFYMPSTADVNLNYYALLNSFQYYYDKL